LPISVKEIGVVWNRTDSAPHFSSKLDGIRTFGCIPPDESVFEASVKGKSIFEIDKTSPAYSAVCKMVVRIGSCE